MVSQEFREFVRQLSPARKDMAKKTLVWLEDDRGVGQEKAEALLTQILTETKGKHTSDVMRLLERRLSEIEIS